MTARKRWTEPELPLPASDLALVAEQYVAPTETPTIVAEPSLWGHHPDCDGFRYAHRTLVLRDGVMVSGYCEECEWTSGYSLRLGPKPLGLQEWEADARFAQDHGLGATVVCDGRCTRWDDYLTSTDLGVDYPESGDR